jgi:hypothetical protein
MADRPDFQQRQYDFAAHIRDPRNVAAPAGIEDRRMAIYRELFFNNLKSLLSTTFPVLRRLHDDQHWRRIIRAFMQVHQSQTPYFLELPAEFLTFITEEYSATDDDFPFLAELAHYEYVELALSVSESEISLDGVDTDGNLMTEVPVKSELAWAFAYQYPVHRIARDFLPDTPPDQATYLAVVRDHDDKVRFHELNPVTAALLDAIDRNESEQTGEQLLRSLGEALGFSDIEQFLRHGEAALDNFRQSTILLGTKSGGGAISEQST